MNALNRRHFLRTAALSGAAGLVLPKLLTAQTCGLTSTDRYGLGPFAALGPVPNRAVLADANEPGQRLFVAGKVTANDCAKPLPGAVVEIWHADNAGCYHHPTSCGARAAEYYLYTTLATDLQGRYAFESIVPGRYLNGSEYRPSHIHFRVTAADNTQLVTQLYFEGDPYIPNDYGASDPDAAARIIPLSAQTDGQHGVFDIVLNATGLAIEGHSSHGSPLPAGFGVYPAAHQVLFDLPPARAPQRLEVFSVAGRRMAQWDRAQGRVVWNASLAPSGIYIARLSRGETRPAVKSFSLLK